MDGMKLYHGTSIASAHAILADGLLPRGARVGNFSHSVESCADAVYLTSTYPLYFAAVAAGNDMRGAVIEIETDTLYDGMLNADEDTLEQVGRGYDSLPKAWSMNRRTKHYRDRLLTTRWDWRESLNAMGTCCYLSTIWPASITRAVAIDFRRHPRLLLAALDASITVLNYQLCSPDHRRMTQWVFGDELEEPSNWLAQFGNPPYMEKGRDGIDFLIGSLAHERNGISGIVSG